VQRGKHLFVHIGGDIVIALSDLVAIIDAESMEKGSLNAQAIRLWNEKGLLHKTADGPVNAWVVTTHRVYASPISAATLRKRAENFVKALGGELPEGSVEQLN